MSFITSYFLVTTPVTFSRLKANTSDCFLLLRNHGNPPHHHSNPLHHVVHVLIFTSNFSPAAALPGKPRRKPLPNDLYSRRPPSKPMKPPNVRIPGKTGEVLLYHQNSVMSLATVLEQ